MIQHDPETMTQPDAHFHHAFNNLPDWALKSSTATRSALKGARLELPEWHASATSHQQLSLKIASREHWGRRNRLEATLDKLKNARDFAEPLLSDALNTRFGLELDVKTTFLRLYIPLSLPWLPIKTGAARTRTVSLLDAALHNFEEAETRSDAHEPDSSFITQPSPSGQFTILSAIKRKLSIQDFTRLCRELDIGGQYEAYLKDNLGVTNPVAAATLKAQVIPAHKAALRLALNLAHAQGDIPTDAYLAMLGMTGGDAAAYLDGPPLDCHDLTMMSSLLTGIVIFAPRLDQARNPSRIIAYVPDDPQHPLKQYPHSLAFMTELTEKLRAPGYQAFFSRFVDHQERGLFFAGLNQRLNTVTWHEHARGDSLPSWRDTPVDHPNLRFSVTPIKGDLWVHLYQMQLNKILNDGRTLAVSTASADRAARWALWDALEKVAMAIVEVASFVAVPFVPFLGEMMLAYMAYQLLDETFEGIISWAQGLKEEAFGHLLSLVDTVVQTGALAVGSALAAGAFSRLLSTESVALLSPLNAVETAPGKIKYWKPDLTPYEQSIALPADARPDSLGLYTQQGKTLLRIEDTLYEVKPDSQTGRYQIQHPDRTDAYRPSVRHNQHGAWQTSLEQPLTWDRETVMRRLGPSVDAFTNAEREQILQISGFHDNVLRETHVDNQRPPSLLTDTIKRFKIDRDIQALIEHGSRDNPERYQALQQRKLLFETRYRALEKTDDRQVQLLLGDIPGLPTDIATELVDNASGGELLQMAEGRVPPRLKEVALKAMEAVRGARAHEGFYLAAMESADTHRLALHSLESLPDWPAGLRIEVREFSAEGALFDSIGPPDAPAIKVLVQTENGFYRVNGISEPATDFYAALLRALPEADRNVLKLSLTDSQAFKQLIVEQAANRPELRTVFAKYPHRKPFYDPGTLRLPGGAAGYPRIGSATPTLGERVLEIYPGLDQEQWQGIVAGLQRHPAGARVELTRLANELERLHSDLNGWIADIPTIHPETRRPMTDLQVQAEHHNRRLLAQQIQSSWRRQSERDHLAPEDSYRYVLRFPEPILGDLPVLSADFSHVSCLELRGSNAQHGINGFLRGFSGLRRLDLRRFSLTALPDTIPQMTGLDTLLLHDCNIRFDQGTWSTLAPLKKLMMLDLFGNPFDTVPDIQLLPELTHLDLSNTGLTHIPPSALKQGRLNTLLLIDNQITELPAGLLDSSIYDKRGLHLSNNPLTPQAQELVKQQYFETSYDLGVSAPDADVQRVLALYPTLEAERASDFVYELPGTLAEGRIALTNLEAQFSRLSNDLSAWTANLPPRHPLTGEPFDAQQQFIEHANRDEFKQALEQCWKLESELDDFNEALEPTFELNIRPVITGDLPTLSADFGHVSSLVLQSLDGVSGIGRFLEGFPNLKTLRVRDFNLMTLPDALFNMGQLRSLSLYGCRITLSAESAGALAQMEQIEYLDLSFNPLGRTPDLSHMSGLATVMLNDTGISEIPNGLFQLEELDWADLSTNAITEAPGELLELSPDIAENINLRGNRFSEESLSRLINYFERTRIDFGIEEVINRGEMQISTSEGSEIEE